MSRSTRALSLNAVDLENKQQQARAVRLRFRLHKAFPPENPISVALLRLMAAVNDVKYIQQSAILVLERATTSQAENLNREGELGYLLRMLLAHLHEAGIAFRDLDPKYRGEVDRLIDGNTEAKTAVHTLRSVYLDTTPAGLNKALLEGVRTPWAFPYKHERFKEALESHPEVATLIISEFAGIGRYTVTDDFAKRYIAEKVGGLEAFDRLVAEAVLLAGTLGRAVDHLLGALFTGREDEIIVEEVDEPVTIPPEAMRARGKVRE